MKKYLIKRQIENESNFSIIKTPSFGNSDKIQNTTSSFATITESNGFYAVQRKYMRAKIVAIFDNEEAAIKAIYELVEAYNEENNFKILIEEGILELNLSLSGIYYLYLGIHQKNMTLDDIKEFNREAPMIKRSIETKIQNLNDFFINDILHEYKHRKRNSQEKIFALEMISKITLNSNYLPSLYEKLSSLGTVITKNQEIVDYLNTYFVENHIKYNSKGKYSIRYNTKETSIFYTKV